MERMLRFTLPIFSSFVSTIERGVLDPLVTDFISLAQFRNYDTRNRFFSSFWFRMICILLISLTGITSSFAQTVFQKIYGATSGNSVRQTRDGGYIITGSGFTPAGYKCTEGTPYSLYLFKTDSLGEISWLSWEGINCVWIFPDVNLEEGYSVRLTADGGYSITGVLDGYPFLTKADSLGTLLWTQLYRGSVNISAGLSLQQTSDTGYIIAGATSCAFLPCCGFFPYCGGDVLLIKTNSVGDTLWTRRYGGDANEAGYSLLQTSDSGYVVAGYTTSFGAGGADVYLIRTNSMGDTVWTRTYGGDSNDVGYSVQRTSDDGFIITGQTTAGVYLIKTNSLGDTLWTRTYEGSVGRDIQQTSDGGYIIAGSHTYPSLYLIKVDSSGDTLWTRKFGSPFYDGRSVQQTSDGGYIITGLYIDTSCGGCHQWAYLLKTNEDGIITGVTVSNPDGIPSDFALQQNYPNPFNPSTTIRYELPKASHVTLQVFNMLGQQVATLVDEMESAGIKSVTWDATEHSGGVYFYRLTTGSYSETKKLLLIR